MNMAVAYQRDREPRRRSHERVETARVQVRTKSRPRHLAVSARGMLVMVIVSSLLFCVLVGLIYIKYLIADTQLNINTITEQIHESSNEQTRLEERLDRAKSIQVIMDRAAELGMSQPTEGQILYVQFPQDGGGESMALESGK